MEQNLLLSISTFYGDCSFFYRFLISLTSNLKKKIPSSLLSLERARRQFQTNIFLGWLVYCYKSTPCRKKLHWNLNSLFLMTLHIVCFSFHWYWYPLHKMISGGKKKLFISGHNGKERWLWLAFHITLKVLLYWNKASLTIPYTLPPSPH